MKVWGIVIISSIQSSSEKAYVIQYSSAFTNSNGSKRWFHHALICNFYLYDWTYEVRSQRILHCRLTYDVFSIQFLQYKLRLIFGTKSRSSWCIAAFACAILSSEPAFFATSDWCVVLKISSFLLRMLLILLGIRHPVTHFLLLVRRYSSAASSAVKTGTSRLPGLPWMAKRPLICERYTVEGIERQFHCVLRLPLTYVFTRLLELRCPLTLLSCMLFYE